MTITEEFTESKEIADADVRGCITLGPKVAMQSLRVSVGKNGAVLLTPMVPPSVPESVVVLQPYRRRSGSTGPERRDNWPSS